MRITIDDYRSNPQLRLALELAARRARAQALGRLFSNLLSRLKVNHASSPNLARQG
jgi:hypothetical protein